MANYDSFGYALAVRVLQSEVYAKLDERERAECDELVRRGLGRASSSQPAHTDHPLRHWDRTCPACLAEGQSEKDSELPGMLAVAKGVAEQRFPHTMDAAVWAAEFVKLHPGADEGSMIGWFANAIMAGYDTAQSKAARSATGRTFHTDTLREVVKGAEAMAATGASATHVIELFRAMCAADKTASDKGQG